MSAYWLPTENGFYEVVPETAQILLSDRNLKPVRQLRPPGEPVTAYEGDKLHIARKLGISPFLKFLKPPLAIDDDRIVIRELTLEKGSPPTDVTIWVLDGPDIYSLEGQSTPFGSYDDTYLLFGFDGEITRTQTLPEMKKLSR